MSDRDELAGIIDDRWHGYGYNPEGAADAILAAGYRKPRTITTAEELDALAGGAVVLDGGEGVFEKPFVDQRWWFEMGTTDRVQIKDIRLPATVLYEPTP